VGFSRLKEEILRLLREDEEFRYAVAGLLGLEEILKRLDSVENAIKSLQEQVLEHSKAIMGLQEQVRSLQEQVRSMQEQVESLQEQVKSMQEQVRGMQEQIRRLQEQVAVNTRALERMASTLEALGMRYGLLTEEAFRESVRYLVEDLLKAYRAERWVYYDSEGIVYGHPSIVEVDLLVRDGERILVEYKASADRGDVAELYRIGVLYERVEGVKPRLLLVAPAVRRRAMELAEKLGVEIRGRVVEP